MEVRTERTSTVKYMRDVGVLTTHVSFGSIFIIVPGSGGSSSFVIVDDDASIAVMKLLMPMSLLLFSNVTTVDSY